MQSIYLRILIFRLNQLRKTVALIGPVYSLLSIGLLSVLLYAFYTSTFPDGFSQKVIFLPVVICLAIHLLRKDLLFLRLITDQVYVLVALEYVLFSLPVIGWFFLQGLWIDGLLCTLLLVTISLIPPVQHTHKLAASGVWNFIPGSAFEWRTGLRQNQFLLVILFAAGILLSFLPYVTLFIAWIINGLLCSFYRYNESLTLLDRRFLESKNAFSRFLMVEYQRHLLVLLPLYLSFLAFHPDLWRVDLGCLVVLSLVFLFTVISKYAYYRPDQSTGPAGLYYALAQISPLLPFLLPVPLVMGLLFYPKAINNIHAYRHATN